MRAAAVAARYKDCRAFVTLDTMLAAADVEAVRTAAPNYLHADLVERCLSAGKHVMVEKPMATTAESAVHLQAVSLNTQAHVQAAFQHRFRPSHCWLRDAIQSGRFGTIRWLRIHRSGNTLTTMTWDRTRCSHRVCRRVAQAVGRRVGRGWGVMATVLCLYPVSIQQERVGSVKGPYDPPHRMTWTRPARSGRTGGNRTHTAGSWPGSTTPAVPFAPRASCSTVSKAASTSGTQCAIA